MKSPEDDNFDKFWAIYPKRPGANKLQTRKQWETRLKQGAFAEEMIYGAMRYAAYCKALKTEAQYIKQAATFVGPNKHYMSEWSAVSKQNARKDWADRLTGKGADDGFIIDG